MRDEDQRFRDILDAIENIERHTQGGQKEFGENELIQTWVIHHLQIIGEAANNISDATKGEWPEISWRSIIGMRNILVHGYFYVDADIAWKAVEEDLPPLKKILLARLS